MILMRSAPAAAVAAFLLAVLAGCVPPREAAGAPGPANPIIVREFAVSPGVVALDRSFGFSLNRGAPGVPLRQRAQSVGRAAAFSLADAIATELGNLGYDAIRSNTGGAAPGGRAMIVSGAFRHIDEGHRRQYASVAVDVEIDTQTPGAAPTRLTTFHLDSRRMPREKLTAAAARHGADANSVAAGVGRFIGRYAADLARINHWPAAVR